MIQKRRIGRGLCIASIAIAVALALNYRRVEKLRDHAQSFNCASAICAIGLAARLYANDRDGQFPTNFPCFYDELATPKVLHCPADIIRPKAGDWSAFTDANSSYEILEPGLRKDATNTAFLRCRVHGHLGYTDGTVFDGARRRRKFD